VSEVAPQVFASVGSMFPFDRFVAAVDDWAAARPDVPVEIQIGGGAYEPRHARFVRMMPPALYARRIAEARLFIAHAGMGSIISAIEAGKPLLMMPRRMDLREHTTDHQFATVAKFRDRTGMHVADDEPALHAAIDRLLAAGSAPPAPIDPYASPELLAKVRAFIKGS
jgi:UDP-N-acetylglucosamine transferase subunit ALG13